MPIDLFTETKKYIIQDAGIGSDMPAVSNHYSNLYQFLGNGMTQEAAAEAYNLYANIFMMLKGISIDHLTFACFVHSIQDKPLTDHSETNLRAVCKTLGQMGLTHGHVIDILDDLKKNLMPNLF
jgi:hypothetical protein